mgnify:CR=1 FL=1
MYSIIQNKLQKTLEVNVFCRKCIYNLLFQPIIYYHFLTVNARAFVRKACTFVGMSKGLLDFCRSA